MKQSNQMTTFSKMLQPHQPQTKMQQEEAVKRINQMQMDKAYQNARLASSFQRQRFADAVCDLP